MITELSTENITEMFDACESSDDDIDLIFDAPYTLPKARAELSALIDHIANAEQMVCEIKTENATLLEQLATAERSGYELAWENNCDCWHRDRVWTTYAEAIKARDAKDKTK